MVPHALPAIPASRPTIWVVNDADTVIYLFGTFHALNGKSAWFNHEVQTAFAASDELVLEAVVPEGPLPATAKPDGSTAATPSFLATTRLAITAGGTRGMDVDRGADTILRRAAEASGKPIGGLETVADQIGMFGRMPEQATGGMTAGQDVHMLENLSIVMDQMQAAWNRGDPRIFSAMLSQMRTDFAAQLRCHVHPAEQPLGELDRRASAQARNRLRRCRHRPSDGP